MDSWNSGRPLYSRSYLHHIRIHNYMGVPNQHVTFNTTTQSRHLPARHNDTKHFLLSASQKAAKGRLMGTFPAMHRQFYIVFSFLSAYEQSKPSIIEYRSLFYSNINLYFRSILKVVVFVCVVYYI